MSKIARNPPRDRLSPGSLPADVRAGAALLLLAPIRRERRDHDHRQQTRDQKCREEQRRVRAAAFATAAFAAGERDAAADVLLAMIAEQREWNEDAARAKLLQIFEAVGLEDPWVAATRRRLSLVLFG